ncbi:site-specific DNA-methyltransferase [Azospirillum largimobile]
MSNAAVPAPVSKSLTTLLDKLREMFQLDRGDLDFGIYRIMNFRRAEIDAYLARELPAQVREVLEAAGLTGTADLKRQLDRKVEQARGLDLDPDTVPAVIELRERLTREPDTAAVEDEVYSHLYKFFNRYYDDGDFISQRRAKDGAYLIPYEGQEVKLHWANHDQYYVKSSESFTNYTFKLEDSAGGPGRRVRFRVVQAETERDNNKAAKDKQRRFRLATDEPVTVEDGDLIVRFTYTAAEEKAKQDALNAETAETLLGLDAAADWRDGLAAPAPTPADATRRVIDKHLAAFTAKNSFDYFIHKDLRRFLLRELEQYVKDEVVSLDALEAAAVEDNPATLKTAIAKSRAIRDIAKKIIAFLAQLEDFQKKLWLKKKFVIETQWCVTLDRVPEDLYPQIAANETQRAEWVRLFAIDRIEGDLAGGVAYPKTGPLTVEFLKANPFLVLDTRFFDETFTAKLLASFDDVDAQTDGLLVHGENFGALNLLRERFSHSLDLIYIDPPYNTGFDEFIYKDAYQRSSWASMLYDRVKQGFMLQKSGGTFALSLDGNEAATHRLMFDSHVANAVMVGEFVWRTRNTDNRVTSRLSVDHEYIFIYAKDTGGLLGRVIDRSHYTNPDNDQRGAYTTDPLTGKANAQDRPNLHYDMVNPSTGDVYPPDPDFGWITDFAGYQDLLEKKLIAWPKNPLTGKPRKKRFASEADLRAPISSLGISISQGEGNSGLSSMMGSKVMNFPKPVSVIKTIIDCSMPERGMVLDYFGGSGTTAHAAIDLNRNEGGLRKYILVEVGDHFDNILLNRVKKSVYSGKWEAGIPVTRDGISHCFKVIRLESYEDALDNLKLERSAVQEDFLNRLEAGSGAGSGRMHPMKVEYLLLRMLETEAAGGSLLDFDRFADPTGYTLTVTRDGEPREVRVDLLETFNYLIGLTVRHVEAPLRFRAAFERLPSGRLVVARRGLRQDAAGPWWFRTVEGTQPDGEKALIVWRTLTGDMEQDNAVLDAFVNRIALKTRDAEYDTIWVNGDNNLQNLRLTPDEEEDENGAGEDTPSEPAPEAPAQWKVRLIEDDFHRLMFAEGER